MKNTLIQYQGGGYDGCIVEWYVKYTLGQDIISIEQESMEAVYA